RGVAGLEAAHRCLSRQSRGQGGERPLCPGRRAAEGAVRGAKSAGGRADDRPRAPDPDPPEPPPHDEADRRDRLRRRRAGARRDRRRAEDLPELPLADHRCDAAVDRGDGGRDHATARTKNGRAGHRRGARDRKGPVGLSTASFQDREETRLILASASASRAAMLTNAGLTFSVEPSTIDEAPIKREMTARGAAVAWGAERLARG